MNDAELGKHNDAHSQIVCDYYGAEEIKHPVKAHCCVAHCLTLLTLC